MALIVRAYNVILLSLLLLLQTERVNAEPTTDKQALLAFLSQIPHAKRIKWNQSESVCNWPGVGCDSKETFIITIHLPGADLLGAIPPNTIGRLSQLRVLSLHSNRISGEVPSDFANLTLLHSLYLHKNELTGEFPPSLTRLSSLVRLDLSFNNFTGSIPFSINNLNHLAALLLNNNAFSGDLVSISAQLDKFNVSNNHLNGSIPKPLSKFPASSFAGNLELCGEPLPSCSSSAPAPSPIGVSLPTTQNKFKIKLSKLALILIAAGCSLLLLLLIILLFLFVRKNHRQQSVRSPNPEGTARAAASGEAGPSSSKGNVVGGSGESESNKLVFFGGGVYSFVLEDLLRASAEVLGKGTVGTSYKAVLEEGTTVVVKRLKDVVLTRREFDTHMEFLGNIKHHNVVALRAFYFSKDEKLLVSDYMSAGSMSALLHGSKGRRTPLDWDSRMRIGLSAARGLSHLHVSGVVHGNIKGSNILLESNHYACLSDYGLNPLFSASTSPQRIAGYRAPEVMETRRMTFKSDVYSFGVLLLELLTGKAPNQTSFVEEGIDLPKWVQSVVRAEWTAEVFDVELMRDPNTEEEMVQLLQIAMTCVAMVPDQRPDMRQVLRMIEDMNRGEITDYGLQQSSDDPSKGSDGRHTPPSESRTPPRSVTP